MASHSSPSSSSITPTTNQTSLSSQSSTSTSKFTCALCSTTYPTSLSQRTHMKSPWHVYNLKRRIASLPPISLHIFETQVSGTGTTTATDGTKVVKAEKEGEKNVTCEACHDNFEDRENYQKHLKRCSSSHPRKGGDGSAEAEAEAAGGDGIQHLASISSQISSLHLSDPDSSSEEEEDAPIHGLKSHIPPFSPTTCLFCPHPSPSFELNISHMQQAHNLSIPNLDTLTDPETFFAYLYTVIERFCECLFCGRSFDLDLGTRSQFEDEERVGEAGKGGAGGGGGAEKARQHMRDKNHCGIDANNEEYSGFWEEISDRDDFEHDHASDNGGNGKGKEKGLQKLKIEGEKISLLGNRTARSRAHRHPHPRRTAITSPSPSPSTIHPNPNSNPHNPSLSPSTSLTPSRRTHGILGLTPHAQQTLRATEKKMIRAELRARNEVRAVVERAGNKQKHFRADAPGGRPNG